MSTDAGLRIRIQADASGVEQTFNKVSVSAGKAAQSISATSDKARKAGVALQDVSRIISDAPYALLSRSFVSIQNNIDPVVASFGRLRAATGSTGAALKSLVGGLIGSGGIGLAIAAASSALVIFGDEIFGTKKKVEETDKAVKEVAKSLASLGAEAASSSIANIQKFSIALNDVSLSTETRKKALEEYNKIASEGNQIQEKDLNNINAVNSAINQQIELLKRQALMKGAQDKLAESFKKVFDAQFKLKTDLRKQNPTLADASEYFKPVDRNTKDFITDLNFDQTNAAIKQLGLNFYRTTLPVKGVGNEIKQLKDFIGDVIKEGEKFGGIFSEPPSLKKVKVIADKTAEALRKAKDDLTSFAAASRLKDIDGNGPQTNDIDNQGEYIRNFKQQYEDGLGVPFTPFVVDEVGLKEFKDKLKEGEDALKKTKEIAARFDEDVRDVFSGLGEGVAEGIGEGLGDLISGEGLQEAGKRIAGIMGDFLQQLGKLLIKQAIATKAFKDAFSKLLQNPAAAIATGVGLVAIGGAIKNSIKVPKLAQGGIAYGESMAIVGEYANARSNPEIIAPLSKLKDLIGKREGGEFPAYLPAHRFDGADLLMWYERAQKQQRR